MQMLSDKLRNKTFINMAKNFKILKANSETDHCENVSSKQLSNLFPSTNPFIHNTERAVNVILCYLKGNPDFKRLVVSVCSGRSQTEVHSDGLYLCLDIQNIIVCFSLLIWILSSKEDLYTLLSSEGRNLSFEYFMLTSMSLWCLASCFISASFSCIKG